MKKTLKEIIQNSNDLYLVNITKPDRHNKRTWVFDVIDNRLKIKNINIDNLQIVQLRRNNYFFYAYKYFHKNEFIYFVDPKKAMFRTSIRKYVNSLLDYAVYTNDISETKNSPSFRVTENEMKSKGINNFLDLCYEYRNYSAIGTGLTRNIRNLIVMDIDVDCSRRDNLEDIEKLLFTFGSYNVMPDFYIYNKVSKHVQLQWLIKNLKYKYINSNVVDNIINEINTDACINKEINYKNVDFMELSKEGKDYQKFTLALCDIVKKKKFGDPNFTMWKAKNPMAAFMGNFDLQLYVPILRNNKVTFLDDDEVYDLFYSSEVRNEYYNEAPDIIEIYRNFDKFIRPYVNKITDKKIKKINTIENVCEKEYEEINIRKENKEISRNEFVFKYTRTATWKTAKLKGFKLSESIIKMKHNDLSDFKKNILNKVKYRFKIIDKKYNGRWPGTTNISSYTNEEFKRTFETAFQWAIQNFNNFEYSKEDRQKSLETRQRKKNDKIMIVKEVRDSNENLTRMEILDKVNSILEQNGQKQMSMGSLKRYISELKQTNS